MSNYIRKEFEMLYPQIAEEADEYLESEDPFELVIRLRDGRIKSYFELNKEVRDLPVNCTTLDEEIFQDEFGIRLQHKMIVKGFTQTTLSEATGISQPSISNYIAGRKTPSLYTANKIAKVLDCSIDEFVYKPY